MKRLFFVIMLFSFFGFNFDILAYETCGNNVSVPCSYNGSDYNARRHDSWGIDYFLNENYCYLLRNDIHYWEDNIVYGVPYSIVCEGGFYGVYFYQNNPTFFVGGGTGTLIQNPPSEFIEWAEFTPMFNLNITRNPQLGGGVIITPPQSFPISYCGLEGKEECEFETSLNDQITLKAQANSGYAFSHWEINNQTMGDTDGTIVIAMSEDKEVEAVFKPILRFPLSGYTSTTVPISAVMDHSLSGGFYSADGRDNRVEAFNGEVGEEQYGLKITDGVRGYKQQSENDFLSGYNYSDPDNEYLFYDEHPGFDFAVPNGTNVIAPFDGKLYWATTDLVNGNTTGFGTFYIDHENGYATWYLHCSGLTQSVLDEIQQNGYAIVSRGDHIAESGNKGTTGYHLHFEVRKDGADDEHVIDPYSHEMWEE